MSIHEQLWSGRGLEGNHVIDAHAHVGPWVSFFTPSPTGEMMLREMARLGIGLSCVSSLLAISADLERGNDEVTALLRRAPDRFRGYVTLNPNCTIDANERELERCLAASAGFIGVKFHPMWHDQPVDGPAYQPLWKLARRYVSIVLGHSWLGHEEPEGHGCPSRYAHVAEEFPELIIILGHGGGTYQGQLESGEHCKRLPNLYMDICAGEFAGLWIEELVTFVPPEKLLFATDMPFLGPGSPLGRVGYANISDEIKQMLLGGNMRSIFLRSGQSMRKKGLASCPKHE